MTADGGLAFVDTNVLVYAHDASSSPKHERAKAVLAELWANGRGTLSTQVLQEFYVTVTRKIAAPLPARDAREAVSDFSSWPVQRIGTVQIVAASELGERHRLSFWDALIIVAARRAGATRLLSEDLRAGWRIDGLTVENPFA